MKNKPRLSSGIALALTGALASAPGAALADPRLQARLYDTGDLTSQCTFSEDGRSARCIGVEGTALNVGYACPEGWSLFRERTNLETAAAAVGDTVRARRLDIQRIIIALVPATEETRELACVAPTAVDDVANRRTVSGDVPQIAPLSLTVVPGRPNLRAGDGQVVEVDRVYHDETSGGVRLIVGAAAAKVIGEGNGDAFAPVGALHGEVNLQHTSALGEVSQSSVGLGVSGYFGNDDLGGVEKIDAQGNVVATEERSRSLGILAVGPVGRLCGFGGIVCLDAALKAGANLPEESGVFLGEGGLEATIGVHSTERGLHAKLGKAGRELVAKVRAFVFGGKDGDEEIFGAGIGVGVER